mmetsp:Transcript_23285/g.59517  ORF Transcript_23285/g.59517 Transcript_23285/m.59517 type:complete len:196 (-) Transcript_23285:466-1053(-)
MAALIKTPATQARCTRSVKCAAVPETKFARRALLAGLMLPVVMGAPKAQALIPDEEDEELLEKARANRAKRLQEERATQRAFMQEEGLKDRNLDQELVPVQKAVYKLAQSGSQLEAGDVKAASRTLSEGWVADFVAAAKRVSTSPPDAVLAQLDALQAAASKGDAKASKRSYVELVDALQAWASASSLTATLKGL